MSNTTKISRSTPGPWEVEYVVDGAFEIFATIAGDHVQIAMRASFPRRHGEFIANAHLIAAAPDLLDALKRAKETIRVWHGMNEPDDQAAEMWQLYQSSPEMCAINAAIAKAEHP